MIRKLTVALAATAVVGTAALAPSAANATWRGYGWYGHPLLQLPWLRL
jgi:ABC-type nitrate/sulfonate/bicarbonate transport system substrate-binding protein